MKYTTEHLKSCTGFSVGSYSMYSNNESFQIYQEGDVIEPTQICSILQQLEQRLLTAADGLKDMERNMKIAEHNEKLLQEEVTSLRKQLRNSKSELTLSETALTRSISSHYLTFAKLEAISAPPTCASSAGTLGK